MGPFVKTQTTEESYTFKGFSGLRNNVVNSRFEKGDLEAGLNIDLDDTGRADRRDGYSRKIVSGACHSVGPSGFSRCFYVAGTTLFEILPDFSSIPVRTGLTLDREMIYFVSGERCYWTNGIEKGCIEPYGNRSWGLTVPPAITGTVSGGNLMLGREDTRTARYQFAMTYLRNDQQESGAPRANYVDVPNNGGIEFLNLPVSTDPTVDRKCLYISEPNGKKLFRAAVIPNLQQVLAYTTRAPLVVPLTTQFLGPPPAGTIVSQQGGSLLVAVANKLHYSQPYAFELFDARKYLVFAGAINVVCSFDNGTHVGTETQHVWLAGDTPDKFEWNTRASYGAIRGTLDFVDVDGAMFGKQVVVGPVGVWASKEGIVKGTPDGVLQNLTRARFLYPIQERGTGLLRFQEGMNQYVVVLQGAETAPKAAILP